MIDIPPPPDNLPALIEQCAPGVGTNTMHALIATESGGNPWAVNDNDGKLSRQPVSRAEAITISKKLIAAGHRVDMGLTQVDSKNLPALGLSVEQIFDPCTNIAAGATILANSYRVSSRRYGDGQPALLAAFSAYNTGRLSAGFYNGYVQRILSHNGVRVEFKIPRLTSGEIIVGRRGSVRVNGNRITPATAPLEVSGWGAKPEKKAAAENSSLVEKSVSSWSSPPEQSRRRAVNLPAQTPASSPLAVAGF